MKPRIFIASPFFNAEQIEIVDTIQKILHDNDYPYYSARIHSGSLGMTPLQKADPKAWVPIFESNVEALRSCNFMIAVIEWALPKGQELKLIQDHQTLPGGAIEVPDSGTVWEMGYWFHANGFLRHKKDQHNLVTYHRSESKKLNLMLSHSTDGIILGEDNLRRFFGKSGPCDIASNGLRECFDWSAVKTFDREVE